MVIEERTIPLRSQKQKVEITVQNAGLLFQKKTSKNTRITHLSLFDDTIAGIEIKNKPFYSVQYTKSSPGPQIVILI